MYVSEMVQLRSNSPLTERSYMLAQPAKCCYFPSYVTLAFLIFIAFCSVVLVSGRTVAVIMIPLSMTLLLQTCCCWLIQLQAIKQCGFFFYGNEILKCGLSNFSNLCSLMCYAHKEI